MREKLASFRSALWDWITDHWLILSLTMLALTFGVVFLSDRIFIFVYPGHAGVVWRRFAGGTDLNTIYGEGMHIIPPWNKVYIYDVRVQQMTREQVALTEDGLAVSVLSSFRFQPNYKLLPRLHQVYGPEYVRKEVIPEVASSIQEIVARYLPDQLYHLMRGDSERQMLGNARRNLNPETQYVWLEDVSMMKITLPPKVQDAIQNKLQAQQVALLYDYRLQTEEKEAQRKAIEAKGIAAFQNTIAGGISDKLLIWKGIEATEELAKSPNSKIVVIGNTKTGLPIVLGNLEDRQK
jgi:regulator of protease activity HflC (stomatin/prohibitin superfamily)